MNNGLLNFDVRSSTRLIFGANCVESCGAPIKKYSKNGRVLLVTDPGVVKAGHVERVRKILEAAELQVFVFDQVRENPSTEDVQRCLVVAKESEADVIVGLGGGSSLDTAKGCNFIFTNGGTMKDYWGVNKASGPMLPFIAIPTTAGTGSECQSFALIADAETHQKMACGDHKTLAKIAILDPTLTLSQPKHVTCCTGVDTLAHAVETAVTNKRNAFSLLYAREAFKLAIHALPKVLKNPEDLEARAEMQLAAAYAGTAIEASMLGAAHSAANPLTAHYGIIHGEAVGLMLTPVVRFNAEDPDAKRNYAILAKHAGLVNDTTSEDQAVNVLIERLDELLIAAEMPRALDERKVEHEKIEMLSDEAARQWTANFNPRAVSKTNFEMLYESVFARS